MRVEFVKDLEPFAEGQTLSLYKLDGVPVHVSTVPVLGAGGNPAAVEFADFASEMLGLAKSGEEETMVFPLDDDGEPDTAAPITWANGVGSRLRVLAELEGKTAHATGHDEAEGSR